MGVFHHHVDHGQHCRVVRIKERVQLRVLPIYGQRILGQVVGADAEKVYLLCQLPAHHDSRRCLDHDALLRIAAFHVLRCQLGLHLFHDFVDSFHLPHAGDHRIHDGQIAVGAGAEQCPQLGLEDLRPRQADTNGPAAHGRILLFFQLKIITLLVGADVQRADDHRLAGHGLHHSLIDLELLFLCGKILFFQVEELTAEQADARRVVLQHRGQILAVADVGVEPDLLAVQGHCLPAF